MPICYHLSLQEISLQVSGSLGMGIQEVWVRPFHIQSFVSTDQLVK